MNDPTESARDDLAFVRALVTEGAQAQASVGEALLAGGLCFGIQCLLQSLFAMGVAAPGWLHLAVATAPTLIFLALIIRISIRDRQQSTHGVGTRALNAAFGGSGLAALTTAVIFGMLATREQSLFIWLFHPLMVCVVQGTVWYIAFAIRRRPWFGLVSGGWLASAVLLSLLADEPVSPWFVVLMGVALLLLMALPGWALMRSAARS